MKTPEKILATTDFSGDSDTALAEAALLAEKFDAELYVLHVAEPVQQCGGDYCISEEQLVGAQQMVTGEAQDKMKQELQRINIPSRVRVIPEIRTGDKLKEILKEEEDRHIDLLVTRPHARRGLKGFFSRWFSHLSDRLIKASTCDVLLVR